MNSVEALLAYWGEWDAHERFRRRRADLQRRPIIEFLLDWYGWPWHPRWSEMIDRSIFAEEDVVA